MTTLLLLVATFSLFDPPAKGAGKGGGGGGAPYEALDAGDVFVATITRVDDRGATNASPPRVWLEVHEVIRGDAKVSRSPAVWSPPFHGIDWGDGNQPELKKWNVTPFPGPKVGQKFILGGRALAEPVAPKDAPRYYLFSFVRTPYSDTARQQTIDHLKLLDEYHRKYAAEVAAAAKKLEEQRREWRAHMTAEVIDRRTQQADAVAIATIVGGGTYEVEQMLKGQPRRTSGGKYYVTLPSDGYDKRIVDIISNRPRVVLFLSEKSLVAGVTEMHARLIDPYEGIVLADAASIAAVKASLEKRPPAKGKPVLVVSAFPRAAAQPLIEAATADFTVIDSHQFSAHGEHVAKHIRKTLPGVDYVVTLDTSGNERHAIALRLSADSSTTLYDAKWPVAEDKDRAKEIVTKLREASK